MIDRCTGMRILELFSLLEKDFGVSPGFALFFRKKRTE
jgi:hypothetical protein